MELEPEPEPVALDGGSEEVAEEALELLDEIDGTAVARKVDEAAFIEMFIKAPPRRGEGDLGSTWRSAGDVLWLIQYFVIVLSIGGIGVVVVGMRFILVPLVSAYFVTFLLAPLLSVFERRPLMCCGRACARRCTRYQRSACRLRLDKWRCPGVESCTAGTIADMVVLLKLPHSLSVLATLATVTTGLLGLYLLLSSSMESFLGQREKILAKLQAYADGGLVFLASNGIKIDAGAGDNATFSLWSSSTDAQGAGGGESALDFAELLEELSDAVGVAWDMGLVLFLAVLLLFNQGNAAATSAATVPANQASSTSSTTSTRVLEEIEEMIRHYITLKTQISLATGLLIWITLELCHVQLAPVFGLMTFLLNFVPNVGSMLATLLPLPIILLDDDLDPVRKLLAFIIPSLIQGYIGNVLEPTLFGASLNMNPVAIMSALVLWGWLWGYPGAVLSVPLLAGAKICLLNADHPLAKSAAAWIQEDPAIDERAERQRAAAEVQKVWRQARQAAQMTNMAPSSLSASMTVGGGSGVGSGPTSVLRSSATPGLGGASAAGLHEGGGGEPISWDRKDKLEHLAFIRRASVKAAGA
jgi:predicted PurR-regulated permease PerM